MQSTLENLQSALKCTAKLLINMKGKRKEGKGRPTPKYAAIDGI
jgi:hypothetical protein